MGSRAALAIVVLALVGCGAENSHGGGGGDMNAGANDMGVSHCAVVHASATDPATGAVTDHAPARLVASVDVAGASGPHWSLQRAGDAPVTPTKSDSTGLRVQYDATDAGTWTFTVSFDSGPCQGSDQVTIGNPLGVQELYRFRVLPPETLHLPLTDIAIPVTGGTPLSRDLVIDSGTPVSGHLLVGGAATTGEVRFIADDGPDAVGFAGSDGKFTLAVNAAGDYTPLLIPQALAPAIPRAPHLAAKAKGATFLNPTFDLPGGVAVTGSVVDDTAAAIAGARVVLRAGALPSGPGTSNSAGAFTLYAEPATYTMSFGAADWPEGTVGGVVVPAAGTTASIAYTIARVAVGGSVVGDDGTTPVGNARVTIVSHALANVADVVVGGAAAVHAPGRVARVLFTNADGSLPAMQLPLGTYDLIVEPPGPSLDGLTAFTEVLAGAATWTLRLQKPVPLTITITAPDGSGVGGVQLTAIETAGLGAAPMGTTDASGKYVFAVDAGAPLSLLVEPPAGVKLAGTRIPVAAGGGSIAVPLVAGLLVSGVVRAPSSLTPEPGVRVEALCYSCGSTTPLATSISDANGTYRIYLPDPGNIIVDGGVD